VLPRLRNAPHHQLLKFIGPGVVNSGASCYTKHMNKVDIFIKQLIMELNIKLREAQDECSKLSPLEDPEFSTWIQVIKDLDKMMAEQQHTLSLFQDGMI
jgi:hypothetical protein